MITFRNMTDIEFIEYEKQAIVSFAEDKKNAENLSDEDALKLAAEAYQELLPKGLNSPEQFLYSILLGDSVIGMLWLAEKKSGHKKIAFVYDFLIDEKFRGKGFGRESLTLLDFHAKSMGFSAIKLHVFEHNTYARSLYEKVGYATTGRSMIKNLI
jgi:ribosomal protein S18 acetylase RimI-like enzyme